MITCHQFVWFAAKSAFLPVAVHGARICLCWATRVIVINTHTHCTHEFAFIIGFDFDFTSGHVCGSSTIDIAHHSFILIVVLVTRHTVVT